MPAHVCPCLNGAAEPMFTRRERSVPGPDCAADRDDAVASAVSAHQLDALYRAALDFAARSYCQPGA